MMAITNKREERTIRRSHRQIVKLIEEGHVLKKTSLNQYEINGRKVRDLTVKYMVAIGLLEHRQHGRMALTPVTQHLHSGSLMVGAIGRDHFKCMRCGNEGPLLELIKTLCDPRGRYRGE